MLVTIGCIVKVLEQFKAATFGNMPTNFGSLPNVVEQRGASSGKVSKWWQVGRVAGKVANFEKFPGQSIVLCDAFLSMYISYEFGQNTHPMSNGQPPWPAGKWGLLMFP